MRLPGAMPNTAMPRAQTDDSSTEDRYGIKSDDPSHKKAIEVKLKGVSK
jgi:hypothetical protein